MAPQANNSEHLISLRNMKEEQAGEDAAADSSGPHKTFLISCVSCHPGHMASLNRS